MKIRKTYRHVMVEKTGHTEPFVRFCPDDVIMLDANSVNVWNGLDSCGGKTQLISDMMKGAGVTVTATPIVYDPEDFSPRVRLLIRYENLYVSTDAYIRIEDGRNTEDVFYSILKEIYEKTLPFKLKKF